MAHTVISEHLRPIFTSVISQGPDPLGFRSRCWDVALLAYGKGLYELPQKVNIPPGTEVKYDYTSGRQTVITVAKPYAFASYPPPRMLSLGISPLEMYGYQTIGDARTSYTPIHIATALLHYYRSSYEKMALALLDPSFLRKYAKRQKQDLTSMRLNPYAPEDFGLRTLPFEPGDIVDEIGNLAWFSREYAEHLYEGGRAREGLSRLIQLCVCHNSWWSICERGARSALYAGERNDVKNHSNSALYIRLMSGEDARRYLREVEGVREVLWAVRGDATVEEMRRGLSRLAVTDSKPAREVYKLIGRELTLDDIKALPPRQALTILFNAPLDAVKGLRGHSEELGAIFFAIKDAPITQIQRCVSEHSGRPNKWLPDTNEGIGGQANAQTREKAREEWAKTYGPLMQQFVAAYEWRNDLLEACDPDTAFLSVLSEVATPENSFPKLAVESVLNTHPNIARVRDLMARMPPHLRAMRDRLGQ